MSLSGKTVIAIVGNAGHGKDTVGGFIDKNLHYRSAGLYALADPLKHAFSDIFGIPLELLYSESGKKTRFGIFGGKTLRECLIEFSRACKVIDNNVWLAKAIRELKKSTAITIVTDVRTQHELDYLKNNFNVVSIKVIRPNPPYPPETYQTEMEIEVPNIKTDYVILNNGTLEDLNSAAIAALSSLGVSK